MKNVRALAVALNALWVIPAAAQPPGVDPTMARELRDMDARVGTAFDSVERRLGVMESAMEALANRRPVTVSSGIGPEILSQVQAVVREEVARQIALTQPAADAARPSPAVDQLAARVSALDSEVASLVEQVLAAQDQRAELIASAVSSPDSLRADLSALREAVAGQSSQLAAIEEQAAETATVREALAGQATQIAALEAKASEPASELTALREVVASQAAQIAGLQAQAASPSAEITVLREALAAQVARVAALEQSAEARTAEVAALRDAAAAQAGKVGELQKLSEERSARDVLNVRIADSGDKLVIDRQALVPDRQASEAARAISTIEPESAAAAAQFTLFISAADRNSAAAAVARINKLKLFAGATMQTLDGEYLVAVGPYVNLATAGRDAERAAASLSKAVRIRDGVGQILHVAQAP